ncbi:MAG: hypothetical protein HYS25_09080 [Ignavibacteriales bacterium]|nr:hypothetical protein [Ignavibacteriales bacterium]
MLKKILLFSVLALLVLSASSNAQMRMSPSGRAKQLAEQLSLNADQTKKVEVIFTNSQNKTEQIMGKDGFGNGENRDKMMKIREDTNNEVMKILNDKQKSEFKKIIEEQRKRMEERSQNRMN